MWFEVTVLSRLHTVCCRTWVANAIRIYPIFHCWLFVSFQLLANEWQLALCPWQTMLYRILCAWHQNSALRPLRPPDNGQCRPQTCFRHPPILQFRHCNHFATTEQWSILIWLCMRFLQLVAQWNIKVACGWLHHWTSADDHRLTCKNLTVRSIRANLGFPIHHCPQLASQITQQVIIGIYLQAVTALMVISKLDPYQCVKSNQVNASIEIHWTNVIIMQYCISNRCYLFT